MAYQLFLIEDDQKLQSLLKEFLERYNYAVTCVKDYKKIEEQFTDLNPDLVLLDINLPYYDGFYLCRAFRKMSNVPIIIVSARNSEMEQVMGMEIGADDYVVKPLNFDILHAKIKSHLRRNYGELSQNVGSTLSVCGLSLDESFFKMTYDNKSVELSKNEYKLVKRLLEHHTMFVTREDLLETLWDEHAFVDENTLTVNVSRVKQRLKEIGLIDVIKTKRGVGYKIELDVQELTNEK